MKKCFGLKDLSRKTLHYLGNKKPAFLACNSEHIYAAILESSKKNDPFQNSQIYSRQILEISRNFLDMVSVRLRMYHA